MKKTNILILACISLSLFYWYVKLYQTFLDPIIEKSMWDKILLFNRQNFLKGYFISILTALFVHADLTHLIGNMIFLYVFGNMLENELGAKKVTSAFFIGGILSFIAGMYIYPPDTMMLGASAAIFTLTSIAMLTKPLKFSWLFFMPLGLVAMIYFMYNVLAVLYGFGGSIGYEAHICGFMVGLPMGIKWSRGMWKRNLLIAVGLLIVYLVISNLILG